MGAGTVGGGGEHEVGLKGEKRERSFFDEMRLVEVPRLTLACSIGLSLRTSLSRGFQGTWDELCSTAITVTITLPQSLRPLRTSSLANS